MTTQYTPILKLALPVTGELSGTWGDTVNDNITSMVEQAVAGLATISTWTGNSKTLTVANGTTSESRCAMLVAQTGSGGSALTGAGEIVCPASSKLYVLKNDSSFAITLKTAAGTGVAVAAGNTAFLFCDGTNVNACVTTIIDGRVTGNLTVDGNATINGNTTLGNATSDTITATARFASDLVPSTDNARDLGSSGNSWKDVYIDGTAYLALVDINGGTIDGVSIGASTAATIINVDNLRLDGNTLSSTDTNGNVVIAPNGTGDVQLDADTVRVGDSGAAATLTSNGAGALTVTTGGAANLVLSTNSGTDSGTITINNGANANIVLAPNGTGDVQLDADTVRIGDSNTDVTLTSNGTGNLNLSTNGGTNSGTIQIAQGANGNITLTPNGTGSVSVPKLVWSNGTSGRVPYLTTGGQFTDDADMTFDGTTLTVNGLTVSGTPTFSGGTANGVVYLNASKQATTGTALAFDGNALTLGGSAPRLLSNMSGALSTRFIVQNSTTNGNTRVYLYPNGTGTISAINGVNNSDVAATDYQAFDLAVIGTTDVRLSSSATGAATPLPLTFYTNGSEQMRLNSTGLGIGTTSPTNRLTIASPAGGSATVSGNFRSFAFLYADQSGSPGFRLGYNQSSNNAIISGVEQGGGAGGGVEFWSFNGSAWGERARITSAGRFGVGTTAPSSILEAAGLSTIDTTGGAGAWTLRLRDTTATAAAGTGAGLLFQGIKATGGGVGNYGAIAGLKENSTDNNENGYLGFFTVSNSNGLLAERARINSGGNLLVNGTSSNGYLVQLYGSNGLALSNIANSVTANPMGVIGTFNLDINNGGLTFSTINSGTVSERARIDSSGRMALGSTSPAAFTTNSVALVINSATATAYSTTAIQAAPLLTLYGGGGLGNASGMRFSQGGNFELFLGGVQASNGGADFVFQGYNGVSAYAERARITTAGNLGVGTTTPAQRIVAVSSDGLISIGPSGWRATERATILQRTLSNNPAEIDFQNTVGGLNYGWQISSRESTSPTLDFYSNSNSTYLLRMRVDFNGNLMVGASSTDVSGTTGTVLNQTGGGATTVNISNTNEAFTYNNLSTAGTAQIDFRVTGNEKGNISWNNSSTSYNTSSDYRLKEDIQPMTGALAKVAALKPCTYKWKADGSEGEGFIAHELQEVCPQAVTGEKDAVNKDGSIKPQGIDTSFLVATLTAAIQEQQAIINSLKARLDAANL